MDKAILLLTACGGLIHTMDATAQKQKPNIVIIYTDDMGIGDLSITLTGIFYFTACLLGYSLLGTFYSFYYSILYVLL